MAQPSRILLVVALRLLLPLPPATAAARLEVPAGAAPCPCADPSLCRPVTTVHAREVFGFAVSRDTPYDRYDWSQLTTAAWNDDPALMCAAHAAGARVVLDGRSANPPDLYGNATARAAWVAQQLCRALDLHLDGINFDLEDPLAVGNPLALEYTALVKETAEAFHTAIPGSQVSVDVPWSPHGIDGRNYDWAGLARAADLLFIMCYDTQSQIWGRCVASANSPLALARRGVQQWLDLGAPASKLVLGLPWYGYRYECTNEAFQAGLADLCELPPVSFAGCPCSDAAGRQFCYSDIAAMIHRGGDASIPSIPSSGGGGSGGGGSRGGGGGRVDEAGTPLSGSHSPGEGLGRPLAEGEEEEVVCEAAEEDPVQASPFTNCRLASDPPGHRRFQVWFDTPQSLERKYALARELGLRGVGMWNLDCLDYRCSEPRCRAGTEAMWAALHAFHGRQHSAPGAGRGPAALLQAGSGHRRGQQWS